MATAKLPLITATSDVLGGTPVFRGTRVPVQTLIEYLEGGQTIDEFLDGFPTVSREQVIAFLEDHNAKGDYVRRRACLQNDPQRRFPSEDGM